MQLKSTALRSPAFLVGPTAVGKSEVAVELALQLGGEIVSADSMQVYRGMDIGTAKLTMEQRRGVPHHLLDLLDVTQSWDVAKFRELAVAAIAAIQSRDARPIVVGGSGLYVRSLTRGIFQGPGRNQKLRDQLESMETERLRQRLLEADPAAACRIEARDRRRMIRALELFEATGRPISSFQTQWKQGASAAVPLVGLNRPRPELHRRCDERVDRMFVRGFVEEVRQLLERRLKQGPTAAKAIGYAEVIRHLSGELGLEETIFLVKQRTRQFVRRQLSWFRHEPNIRWLDLSEDESSVRITERIREMAESPANQHPLT
ncbi:MAG: tRNA (adenosine(37)-N6)-dimethylallyltransferase MiaA [Verrucomicrobia bacterium]|nr:tRNA (adenosine(37)-N6)-dimethylallyltransferase MiaA [Verrucomicrobiota bacterium]